MHILMIDDDPTIGKLVKRRLENHPDRYQVTIATDAESGVQSARGQKPDLIILDILLRNNENGWEVAEQLKRDARTAGIPILVSTGFFQNAARKDDLGAYINESWVAGYLPKPYDMETLIEAIRETIRPAD